MRVGCTPVKGRCVSNGWKQKKHDFFLLFSTFPHSLCADPKVNPQLLFFSREHFKSFFFLPEASYHVTRRLTHVHERSRKREYVKKNIYIYRKERYKEEIGKMASALPGNFLLRAPQGSDWSLGKNPSLFHISPRFLFCF